MVAKAKAADAAKRTYNPTSPELIQHIEEVLAKNPDANPKDVHAALMAKKELQLWKIPERRVAKFVKRAKSANDDDDDGSVQSTGTMTSIRRYFKERKARKAAKREAKLAKKKQQGGEDDDGDDDISVMSSASSMSSVRKFFARDRSRKNKETSTRPSVKVVVPSNGDKWDHTVSPLKPSGSPRADAFDNQRSEQNASAQNYDADDDDASVSSIRKFLKNRKARKAAKMKQKEAATSAIPAPPTKIIVTPMKPKESGPLLSPIPQSEDEPDLYDLNGVPTYDSYLDEVESEKAANGKTDSKESQPECSSPAVPSSPKMQTPESPSTANTTAAASRDLEGLYEPEPAAAKPLCSACAIWNPFTKTAPTNLVE